MLSMSQEKVAELRGCTYEEAAAQNNERMQINCLG